MTKRTLSVSAAVCALVLVSVPALADSAETIDPNDANCQKYVENSGIAADVQNAVDIAGKHHWLRAGDQAILGASTVEAIAMNRIAAALERIAKNMDDRE